MAAVLKGLMLKFIYTEKLDESNMNIYKKYLFDVECYK